MGYKKSFGLALAILLLASFPAQSPAQPQTTGTGLANVTNTTSPSQTIDPSGPIMLSANVVSGDGGPAPTGTVTFEDITLNQTVSTVALDIVSGEESTATSTVTGVLARGDHQIVAQYSGDSNYAPASSEPMVIDVEPSSTTTTETKGATVTTVTASPPVLAPSTTETLTATIAPSAAVSGTSYTFTGTVSFYDHGTTLLGTATVSSGTATLAGIALANNVSHSVTAIYSGDTNWLASTSAALPLAATTLPDTVVLTSNFPTLSPGQLLVLTVTVTPTSTPATGAEQNPTGNVIFYNGTTILSTVALIAAATGDSATATYTTETLPGGQDTVYAAYQGDLYYDAGDSNPLTLDIQDFTIVPASTNPPTNLTIVQGASGAAGFVITGLGGFNSPIQVLCAVPSQADMTCTTSPQVVTPPGTATFVVQTFLPGQQPVTTALMRDIPPGWPRAIGGSALAILGVFLLPFGGKTRMFAARSTRRLLTLLLLLTGLCSAGIGCSNNGTTTNGTGTPFGVSTLKITASANVDNTVVSHSVYLTVNVVAPVSQ